MKCDGCNRPPHKVENGFEVASPETTDGFIISHDTNGKLTTICAQCRGEAADQSKDKFENNLNCWHCGKILTNGQDVLRKHIKKNGITLIDNFVTMPGWIIEYDNGKPTLARCVQCHTHIKSLGKSAKEQPEKQSHTEKESQQEITDRVEKTLGDRRAEYGQYETNARIAQDIKKIMRDQLGDDCPTAVLEAIDQTASKLARLSQNPRHLDSMLDIAGYWRLAYMEIEKSQSPISEAPPKSTPTHED